jgi:hypothetical protein
MLAGQALNLIRRYMCRVQLTLMASKAEEFGTEKPSQKKRARC